jgi:hypothetical protein
MLTKAADAVLRGKVIHTVLKKFFFLALPFLAAPLFAQTAAELEDLLKIEAVSYEEAAYFVLRAADVLDPSTPVEAFRFAAERRWLPGKAAPDGEADLAGVSLLIMRAFNLKGGIFYSLLKNPHYAYREMVYQVIVQGRADPQMTVSGDLLLFLVNRTLSRQEAGTASILDGQE